MVRTHPELTAVMDRWIDDEDNCPDAFNGSQLDGDGDGSPGGDFSTTFTPPPAQPVIVSLPDFTRGPGQPVDVPPVAVIEAPDDDVTPPSAGLSEPPPAAEPDS